MRLYLVSGLAVVCLAFRAGPPARSSAEPSFDLGMLLAAKAARALGLPADEVVLREFVHQLRAAVNPDETTIPMIREGLPPTREQIQDPEKKSLATLLTMNAYLMTRYRGLGADERRKLFKTLSALHEQWIPKLKDGGLDEFTCANEIQKILSDSSLGLTPYSRELEEIQETMSGLLGLKPEAQEAKIREAIGGDEAAEERAIEKHVDGTCPDPACGRPHAECKRAAECREYEEKLKGKSGSRGIFKVGWAKLKELAKTKAQWNKATAVKIEGVWVDFTVSMDQGAVKLRAELDRKKSEYSKVKDERIRKEIEKLATKLKAREITIRLWEKDHEEK